MSYEHFARQEEEISNKFMSANGTKESPTKMSNPTQNRPFYDRLGNQYGYSSTSMWNKSAIKYFDGSGKKQLIAVLLLVSGLYYVYSKGLLKN